LWVLPCLRVPRPHHCHVELDPATLATINGKRFSIREFLLGNEAAVPPAHRTALKGFLYELMTGFREIAPALSLSKIRF